MSKDLHTYVHTLLIPEADYIYSFKNTKNKEGGGGGGRRKKLLEKEV